MRSHQQNPIYIVLCAVQLCNQEEGRDCSAWPRPTVEQGNQDTEGHPVHFGCSTDFVVVHYVSIEITVTRSQFLSLLELR